MSESIASSPLGMDDLRKMQSTLLFGEDDVRALRMSRDVLADQVEAILDVWYGFVGATPHLVASFSDARTGTPIPAYLAGVRKRFAQWILDTASAERHGIPRTRQRLGRLGPDAGRGARNDGGTTLRVIGKHLSVAVP